MIIALYLYGLLLAGSDLDAIMWMKCKLSKRFEMKDLGEAKTCIGLEISRDRFIGTLIHVSHIGSVNTDASVSE